jgi:hypothetical protein
MHIFSYVHVTNRKLTIPFWFPSGFTFQLKILERLGCMIPDVQQLSSMLKNPETTRSALDYCITTNNQRIVQILERCAQDICSGKITPNQTTWSQNNLSDHGIPSNAFRKQYLCVDCGTCLFTRSDVNKHNIYVLLGPLYSRWLFCF